MSQNTFFLECFMDECAAAAASDPLDYRLQLLQHDARAVRVLRTLAQLSEWQTSPPPGRARGLAFAQEFGSVIAQSVEVESTPAGIAICRIDCVLDCGLVVNPAGVEAQVHGGIVYALSAALFGEITLEQGQVQQSNFDAYRVLRMNEVPQIRVQLISAPESEPGGAGEIPVPALAPAVANAISRLTGKRLRTLPLHRQVHLAIAGSA
jgi:isoquinoline 1-oxidoreductase beta subunit